MPLSSRTQWGLAMTQAQNIFQLALHMRELARDTVLPSYIEILSRAADDLEMRAAELECQAIAA
jgi:hypothetical protein